MMEEENSPMPSTSAFLRMCSAEPEANISDAHENMEIEPDLPFLSQHAESDGEQEIFLGFTEEEATQFYPKVEYKSANLYNIVEALEAEHAASFAEFLAHVEEPIRVPRHALRTHGGSDVYIEKIIVGKGEEAKTYTTGVGKLPKPRRGGRPSTDRECLKSGNGTFRPRIKRSRISSPDQSPFNKSELLLLRRPLALGWIRDVVLKSADSVAPGQVLYISPDGTMVRSYKDLALALSNYPGIHLSRSHFSFTAVPIGGSKNEILRIPQENSKTYKIVSDSGMDIVGPLKSTPAPKRRRPGPQRDNSGYPQTSSGVPPGNIGNRNPAPKRRRRRIQVPPKKTLMEKMQVNDSEGGLFGISALSEIFAGMEKADAERELEEYNHMMSLMEAQENVLEAMDPSGAGSTAVDNDDGEMVLKDELLPCSIRCAGMTGRIPGLQCTRCLCLYHAECLGFEEEIDASSFLCSNCEGSSTPEYSSPSTSPTKDSVYELMQKMLKLKKPTMTTSSPSRQLRGFQGFGKGMSIKRVDPRAGSNQSVGFSPRGRRAQPKIPIPQLTSHNLTITPLSPITKGQLPRLPTLAPINGPRNSNPGIPVYRRGRGGGNPTLIDSIQVNPQRQGNLAKHPFAPLVPLNSKPRRLRYPIPNFGASFGTVKQPTANIFRNYPQSVVSVGQKNFIVIPKGPSPNTMRLLERNSTSRRCEAFGKEKSVLREVFKYLMVKDLLHASRVNSVWKEEAVGSKVWEILRLKNTRIYDIESFGNFVAARGTTTIDFRKMLGTVDWTLLFMKLSSASSLHTVVLGSKAEELREIAQTFCPTLGILETLP